MTAPASPDLSVAEVDFADRLEAGLAHMATACTAPPALWQTFSNDVLKAAEVARCLTRLVAVIDAAGIQNLTRGVQLGQISWAVKCGDAVGWANSLLESEAAAKARAEGGQ